MAVVDKGFGELAETLPGCPPRRGWNLDRPTSSSCVWQAFSSPTSMAALET